ncbi:MAG: hypothetical protein QNK30_03815, partial [Bacteroidales bacterium]|nr:hypothetical protein [Bacteroidales bacterium]
DFHFIKLYLTGKYHFTLFLMKLISRIVLLLLLVLVLAQCRKDEASPVVNIPDENFLNALIELGVDTDGDGKISPEEAEAIISLDVSEKYISDMTGIEAFVNLDYLICYDNLLARLDISNNIALTVLNCSQNPLNSLDVSTNMKLKRLDCFGTQLSSIDVSNNTCLEELLCSGNKLSTLDVTVYK